MDHMSNNYKYTLIQEGPFITKDEINKDHINKFVEYINANTNTNTKVIQSTISSGGVNYNSQFYLVTRKDDNDVYSSAGYIFNNGTKLFSGFAENILTNISGHALEPFQFVRVQFNFYHLETKKRKTFGENWS